MGALRRGVIASLALCVVSCRAAADREDGLRSDLTGQFGHPDSVLFWTPDQQLAGFPNYDQLFPTRLLLPGREPFPLPRRLRDLSDLRYEVDGQSYDLEDFFEHNRVAGLLVLKDGEIVMEEYRLGHAPDTPWVSYSVTKSVVSILFGAAIADGYVSSVEDLVTKYLPQLEGTSYDGVTIRDLLQMASGVEWNEDYTDPEADVSQEIGMTDAERISYLSSKGRRTEPGTSFNYNTGETHLAGAVLRAAIGDGLTQYLNAKIWQPFGMEHAGNWRLVEDGGAEHGGCCISATLRDYGRIGVLALRDGVLRNGQRVVAEGWISESMTPSASNPGYGYLWWLGPNGSYAARGIFGQGIFVDPRERTVIVTHSVWPTPTGRQFSAHRDSLFSAVKRVLRSTG